jgi:nickel-dependent lactate racemase
VTAREKLELLTPFIAQRIRTIDHNPDDESALVDLGHTRRGTPIRVNRSLLEHTHVILTGAVGFHYFAGFTGGRKSVSPGLASSDTITSTHILALDFERGGRQADVGPGLLEGNPIHEECVEIAERVSPAFLINSIVNDQGQPVRTYAGNWKSAHARACADYMTAHSVRINARRELVIASCGGSPYDINLIQAHKALDMAALACEDGGTILLLAECRDGLGRPDFLKWFEPGSSAALESRLRTAYEVNGQTAWALLTKTERYNVVLVSHLPEEQVRQMGMVPAANLDQALKYIPSDAEGFIMPRAGAILPLVGA